jgi:hypothetical protein
MAFTDKEREQFFAEKRTREAAHYHEAPRHCPQPAVICIHCQNPFGFGEGYIGEEVALCDVCNGD